MTFFIFGSVLLVSAVSLTGVFLLSLRHEMLQRILLNLVSFSTGALLGNTFIHLLPEVIEHSDPSQGMLLVLAGIVVSFVIEKVIHWRHCHTTDCHDHTRPVGTLVLVGDAAHNILDGILIAATYLVSIPLGIAATIAVILHEVPQEIGDFAIMLHSGFSRARALLMNFLTALTALIGAGLVLLLAGKVEGLESILLPITAGNFLYIAGADLLPELHRETRIAKTIQQLVLLLAGIALMYALSVVAEPHTAEATLVP
ncbi:MAG: zinc/iron permease [Candidatus Peregrinibacteria bacterium Gr01-1014_25]|nr:MAG: zinc/iron permease [Candidatus Peregrinibacteria bacterium Gr01-1014_25]